MFLTKEKISELERVPRLKLINSICGIRGVHLIGTKSQNHVTNLAIFSSVMHLGSNPPLLGFISRPSNKVKRDTLSNIVSSGYYSINSINDKMVDKAHQTSGKYHSNISEFKACGFTEYNIDNFDAPFVLESHIKIGMKLLESIPIKFNNTCMVVGEIQIIKCKYPSIEDNLKNSVGVLGLNSYYSNEKIKELKYVRLNK